MTVPSESPPPAERDVREKQKERRRAHTPPSWTQEALARLAQLEGRLELVDDDHAVENIRSTLRQARRILHDPVPLTTRQRMSNWWNGDRIEAVWTWLEEAEIEIVQHSNTRGLQIALAIARQRAETAFGEKNRHRVALEQLATTWTAEVNQ